MTEPLRRACRSLADLPATVEIGELASWEHHLVLRFPGATDDASLQGLARQWALELPNHKVFVSGRAQVTVIRVPSREQVLECRSELVQAARNFRSLARCLAGRLAQRLAVSTAELSRADFTLGRRPAELAGRLGPGWRYQFHGYEVAFHQKHGLLLDVLLGYPEEFGVLDPWFFARFVAITPKPSKLREILSSLPETRRREVLETLDAHQAAHTLLNREFHYGCRVMDVLESTGDLVRVEPRTDHPYRASGLVALG